MKLNKEFITGMLVGLVIVLILFLTGCGAEEETQATTTSTTTTAPTTTTTTTIPSTTEVHNYITDTQGDRHYEGETAYYETQDWRCPRCGNYNSAKIEHFWLLYEDCEGWSSWCICTDHKSTCSQCEGWCYRNSLGPTGGDIWLERADGTAQLGTDWEDLDPEYIYSELGLRVWED